MIMGTADQLRIMCPTGQTKVLCADLQPLLRLQDVKKQTEVMSWLMFQMGGLGPMQGQVCQPHVCKSLVADPAEESFRLPPLKCLWTRSLWIWPATQASAVRVFWGLAPYIWTGEIDPVRRQTTLCGMRRSRSSTPRTDM